MPKEEKFVRKNITIREDQEKYIKEHFVNLSRFVQKRLDEMMDK